MEKSSGGGLMLFRRIEGWVERVDDELNDQSNTSPTVKSAMRQLKTEFERHGKEICYKKLYEINPEKYIFNFFKNPKLLQKNRFCQNDQILTQKSQFRLEIAILLKIEILVEDRNFGQKTLNFGQKS